MARVRYFNRNIDKTLQKWAADAERKPLLLRGARQVGKTAAVRHLAGQFDHFLEIDFNEKKQYHRLFSEGLTPQEICQQLSVLEDVPIVAGKTLLFFDEIQACPDAINALRYFYEKYPELHLVAAGSLLEFTLAELPSFGVGRIQSVYIYPFCFDEFLRAVGQQTLADTISAASATRPLPDLIHQKAVRYLRTFMLLGGMPEVVSKYAQTGDLLRSVETLDGLIESYEDDFKKYTAKANPVLLRKVLQSVARQNAGKFVYSQVDRDLRIEQIKEGLEMLCFAGLVMPVYHTAANGVPLGAEVNDKYRKMILFDTGIMQRLLKLQVSDYLLSSDVDFVNKGVLAEVMAGLEIIKAQSVFTRSQLYYWHREEKNAIAEVDYVIEKSGAVLPIEVKSGTIGKMKSLQIFLQAKHLSYGIRSSLENFAQYDNIRVYPLYAIRSLITKD